MRHWLRIVGKAWEIHHRGCDELDCPVRKRVSGYWPKKYGGDLPPNWRHRQPGWYEIIYDLPEGLLRSPHAQVSPPTPRSGKIVACV